MSRGGIYQLNIPTFNNLQSPFSIPSLPTQKYGRFSIKACKIYSWNSIQDSLIKKVSKSAKIYPYQIFHGEHCVLTEVAIQRCS